MKAGRDVDLEVVDEDGDEDSDVLECGRGQARLEEHGGVLVLISQSRHSGPLGPSSLQWQKCQLTLLFSRQSDPNRELRNQAPR